MKKVNGCADGGYAKMQLKLLAGTDICMRVVQTVA